MRRSREAAAESRRTIVGTAARMLRERGVEGASIADVCEAAGMTHGGFYKHFETKDQLLAEAAAAAFEEIISRFDKRAAAKGAESAREDYVAQYLSTKHLAHPELGCPVAAFGADAGRRPEALAAAFAAGIEALIARMAGPGEPRDAAIRRLLTLVGAVVAARAVGEGALRREILAAARGGNE